MQLLSEFLVFVFGYVLVLLYSITALRLEHDSLLSSLLCIMYCKSLTKKYYLGL